VRVDTRERSGVRGTADSCYQPPGTWSASANTWTTSSGGSTVFMAGDTATFSGTAGGTLTLSGSLAPASLVVSATAGTYTFSGGAGNLISGSGALGKSGAGVAVFASDNSWTGGATLAAGTIRVGTDGALGSGSLSLTGGALTSADASARVLSNPVAVGGDVAIGDGTGTGAMTFSGGVDLGGGTRSITTVVNTTFSGTISNGGLTKLGAGRLTLTATSTYTGVTTVSTGRLAVNGALGDSPVMVLVAAEFGGSGSIGGPVSVADGGTLSPGNSIESLATGTATFAAAATFAYEVDSTNPLALGSAADLLVVSGDLNLDPGNGTLLTITDLASSPNSFEADTTKFALINYSGNWNGGLFTYAGNVLPNGSTFAVGSQQWMIDYDLTSSTGLDNFTGDYLPSSKFVAITAITPVPEPSTSCMALAGLACGGFSMWRRRKRA
jgi:autotransporter-associated beta strand protein